MVHDAGADTLEVMRRSTLWYRIFRRLHEGFQVSALMLYVIAFAAAFTCLFVFPPVTILLFWLGLFSLPLAFFLSRGLGRARHAVAAAVLRRGHCPLCGERVELARAESRRWSCVGCGAIFAEGGVEQQGREVGVLTMPTPSGELTAPDQERT